ncbi:transposable element Tc1 transposase [Trichonephila clavipes]|nr:transposable element Tc1 transposase [Trichonephila clavipes]
MPGELLFAECNEPTIKFGGVGIMVYVCFLCYGLGPMIPVHGKLNADSYSTFLDNNVLPTLKQFYGLGLSLSLSLLLPE